VIGRGRPITIVGTGEFATRLCRALAAAPPRYAGTVQVVGRTEQAAATLCASAQREAGGSATLRFEARRMDFGPYADFRGLLAELRPHTVVVCASAQSPAEFQHTDNGWSRLVRAAGFAVTLPLQAALAARISAACADVGADADQPITMVNACFPDGVNPTLRARGLPVLCGVGNVGSLATAAAAALDLADPGRLKLLAHHAHLYEPADPGLEARCWLDDQPYEPVAELLRPIRSGPRSVLNGLGATATAAVVRALADGGRWVGHLPGPAGLPGGFPAQLDDGALSLRLPAGTSLDSALAWTDRVSTLDGASVGVDGTVRFTDQALEMLRRHLSDVPADLAPQALPELFRRLLELRDRLRRQA